MNITNESCIRFMPPELVSHLWHITELYGAATCTFVLSARKLGDRKVQDIQLDIDGFTFHHTIFGLPPVNWTVRVRPKDGDLVMAIVLSEKAMMELNKWKKIKSALSFRSKTRRPAETQHFFLNKAG